MMPTEEELEQILTDYIHRDQNETKQAIDSICNQMKANDTKENEGGGKN